MDTKNTQQPVKSNQVEPEDDCGCNRPLTEEEEKLRQGRKSMVMPMRGKASSKVRYVEGSMPLKDGCWLSD